MTYRAWNDNGNLCYNVKKVNTSRSVEGPPMSESNMPSKPVNEIHAEADKESNIVLPVVPQPELKQQASTPEVGEVANLEHIPETDLEDQPRLGLTGQLGSLPPEPAPAKRKIPILRRLSTQESQIEKVEVDEASGEIICPDCGRTARVGELACANCGHVFSQSARTHKFAEPIPNSSNRNHPAGEASVEQGRPIVFEVEGDKIHITLSEHLIIGRIVPGDKQNLPDVDLARLVLRNVVCRAAMLNCAARVASSTFRISTAPMARC